MIDKPSVIITAGYNHSPVACAMVQLFPRDEVRVAGVVIVKAAQLSRLGAELRRRGLSGVVRAARKALGKPEAASSAQSGLSDPLAEFFAVEGLRRVSLTQLCAENGVAVTKTDSLNDPATTDWIRAQKATGAVYCGGGIIRERFLSALDGKVLNGHAGPLPEIRGMNAVEWSVILGLEPCVTIHFIDAGIDTGPTVGRVPIGIDPGETIERLRAKSLVAMIRGLREHVGALMEPIPPRLPGADSYRQVYTLAPALLWLAGDRLAREQH